MQKPLSLYIHVPFCRLKCRYCAFYSIPCGDMRGLAQEYLHALRQEALFWSNKLDMPSLSSLYIGGGTPSLLSASDFNILFSIIDNYFQITRDTEVSIEANPESLGEQQVRSWIDFQKSRKIKKLRVSLGAQSFNDEELKILGRPHDSAQIYAAAEILRANKIPFSMDLMFSLPKQDLRSFHSSLKSAISLGLEHISIYELAIEPNTPYALNPPDNRKDGYTFYRFAQSYLPKKGFYQYEIASFAKKGAIAQHNLSYWLDKEYIGMGPGAWGYIDGWRYKNAGSLDAWTGRLAKKSSGKNTNAICFAERLDGATKIKEAAILALRTKWGWKPSPAGEPSAENLEKILSAFSDKFVVKRGGRWTMTQSGWRVANRIWEEMI